jgi:RNA recognition motif-containing protein
MVRLLIVPVRLKYAIFSLSLTINYNSPAGKHFLAEFSCSIRPIEEICVSGLFTHFKNLFMNLYVSNISRSAKEDALRELFAEFGEVTSAKIINDRYTGESKGFGFVEMTNENEALEAIKELTNKNFEGRNLVVTEARPKAPASGNSGFNKY